MGYNAITLGVISGFWAVVGIIVPFFIPNGPNKRVIQMCLLLTAVCSWLFWIWTYLVQMNPLIGPKLKRSIILMMATEWGNGIKEG